MKDIKCVLGFHKYVYYKYGWKRYCKDCGCVQYYTYNAGVEESRAHYGWNTAKGVNYYSEDYQKYLNF
uniref:Uncharacterized protein n=1 Tax=viral metagenome TaxID=1070528 RepID=A0A6M3JUG7_9ZZZZ